jgi:hypothetical protein
MAKRKRSPNKNPPTKPRVYVKPVPRHPSEVAEHRKEIMRLMRRGWTQDMIAEQLGIAQETVSKDYRMILKEWHAQRTEMVEEEVTAKLAEYLEIRTEAWAAWERSKIDAEKVVNADGPGYSTETKTREGRIPANEYLRTVLNCLQAERELLGLDAVKEVKVQGRYVTAQLNWADLAQQVPDTGPVPDLIEQSVQRALDELSPVVIINTTHDPQALPSTDIDHR